MSDFQSFHLQLNPRKLFLYVLAAIGLLLVMHLWCVYYLQLEREDLLNYLLLKFNLDDENTVPAYFSALLLLLVAVLSGSSALQEEKRKMKLYWIGLAVLFLFLSFDEASSFHELLIFPLRETFGFDGWLYFSWIVPGIVFVFLFGLSYLRFLWLLPRRIAMLFVLSGSLYIAGAVGIEAIGGRYAALTQTYTDWNYLLLVMAEESLEMLGISLFIYALLCYKQQFQHKLKIVIS